jgi:hypothetical protein
MGKLALAFGVVERRSVYAAALLVSVLAWAGASPAPAQAAQPQLIMDFHMDEGGTDSDEVGSTPDSANPGHGSVLRQTPEVAGKFGNALRFTAASWMQDGIHQPQHLTVIEWVRASTTPGTSRYLIAQGSGACVPAAYGMYTSYPGSAYAGGLEFYVNHDGAAYAAPGVPPASIWDGNWHMVAGTFDGSTARFYLDGTEIGHGTSVPGAIDYSQTSSELTIGGYGTYHDSSCAPAMTEFAGDIDEARAYDQALTASEIQRLASATGSDPPTLVVDPPTVHTTGVDQVTSSSARIKGTIDDLGNSVPYDVEYGKTTSYGHTSTSSSTAGASGAQQIAVTLTGLDPDTDYHARLVSGTTVGDDVSFHTSGIPELRFTAATASISETGGGISLTVSRVGGDNSQSASAHFATADGTAMAGSDYVAMAGTLSFSSGAASGSVTIPISDDGLVEGPETFTLTLSNPTSTVTLGTPSQVTVTINDDDHVPTTAITFDPANPQPAGYYIGDVTIHIDAFDSHNAAVPTHCIIDPPTVPTSYDSMPPCTSSTQGPFSTLGVHTVYAAARDAAGNTGPVATRSFRISDIPSTTIDSGPSGETWRPDNLFYFSADISGSTFECRIDRGAYGACTSPFDTGTLAQGVHIFEVRATAPGGAVDPGSAERAYKIAYPIATRDECEVKPVYYWLITWFGHDDKFACEIGTPTRAGCPQQAVCTVKPQTCPSGARCTITTTVSWFDADNGMNWGADAESRLQPILPIDANYASLPQPYDCSPGTCARIPNQTASCETGYGGDRCTATATLETLGNGQPIGSYCLMYVSGPDFFDPNGSTLRDDDIRRIECSADWRVVPAPELAAVPAGQQVQVNAIAAGLLLAFATLPNPSADVASAKAKPKIASVRKVIKGAGPVTIPLQLNGAARRLLKRHHHLKIRLRLTFTGSGHSSSRTQTVTLTAPTAKPKTCHVRRPKHHAKKRPRKLRGC